MEILVLTQQFDDSCTVDSYALYRPHYVIIFTLTGNNLVIVSKITQSKTEKGINVDERKMRMRNVRIW